MSVSGIGRSAPVAVLLLAGMAGCATMDETTSVVSTYAYPYPGAELAVRGHPHGWMVRFDNQGHDTVSLEVEVLGVAQASGGPARDDGWKSTTLPDSRIHTLEAGRTLLYLVQVQEYGPFAQEPDGTGIRYSAGDQDGWVPIPVTLLDSGEPVHAGDHVRTATVGVWVNGTSFYTNIPALNEDSDFPRGYDADGFAGDPLPVYVYGQDRSEQPARSRDTCHFTTIDGYNTLLQTQAEGSTAVRYLTPEEAYTRPGNEGFFLYGHPLVFLNTIVAHDGAADDTPGPEPAGDCFDPANSIPGPIPV